MTIRTLTREQYREGYRLRRHWHSINNDKRISVFASFVFDKCSSHLFDAYPTGDTLTPRRSALAYMRKISGPVGRLPA